MAARKASPIKKRRSRARESFARASKEIAQKERILIACEDSVTAPEYFKAMCNDLGLDCSESSLMNVVTVRGKEFGSAPQSVLEGIKNEIEKEKDNPYNRAYWVVDSDGHEKFLETRNLIIKNPVQGEGEEKTQIIPAHSIPCFEFWVLLHFEKTTRQFKDSKEIEKWIKKNHLSDYTKVTSSLYDVLKNKDIKVAIANSKAIVKDVQVNGDNPSSYVHILVEDLLDQKKKLEIRK